ncbi:MAG: nucleoside-diphosphate kinase [Anaerolineae bacterium]|nr:nucleoside-diphosphate kinase [Anaerolineae bacterium]
MKLMQMDRALAARHYAVHEGQPFYEGLLEYVTSGPVVVAVLEGPDAIELVRQTIGATRPSAAQPGTIRADYAIDGRRNLVHGSDSPETARFEVGLFFREEELVSWQRDVDRWIYG